MREANVTCFDCLYCKVSAESTDDCMLCFCSEMVKRERHGEAYWIENPVCEQFNDMGAEQ